jgi:hypothetical protein
VIGSMTRQQIAALIVCVPLAAAPVVLYGQRGAQPPPAPPPAAPPAPPQPSPEEIRRMQLEEQLKDLQRREVETEDLSAKETLLSQIIQYCIELGRDYNAYKQQLTDVRAKLAVEAKKGSDRQRQQQLLKAYKDRATQAMLDSPPRLSEAKRYLDDVLKVAPRDREALALRDQVASELRRILYQRIAVGSLLSLASIGALVPLVARLRKGAKPRTLEMIEGPLPGEVFALDKEVVALGALAAEADIVISDPLRKVSRRHCEITRNGKYYFLADLSTNGTFINGKPAPKGEPVLLRKGDRIGLSRGIVLRFR